MRIAAVSVGVNCVAIAGPDDKRLHLDLVQLVADELDNVRLGATHSVLLRRLRRFFDRNTPDMIVIAPDVRRSVLRLPRDESVVEQLLGVTLGAACIDGVPIVQVAALATGDAHASSEAILQSARECDIAVRMQCPAALCFEATY